MPKSNDEFIRERAELAGINLSDHDLAIVREKWESSPTCRLDDLLAGLRRLAEKNTAQMLTATNRMIQNANG